MAAVLGLGNAVPESVTKVISSFLGRSWSVVGSCGTDANDVANLPDIQNCLERNTSSGYFELYRDSLEQGRLWIVET